MSESAYRARQKYEISRKKKAVSFNVDRPYEAKLFDFAARLSDFSGWVKENLAEEQSLRISGKPLLTFDNTAGFLALPLRALWISLPQRLQ